MIPNAFSLENYEKLLTTDSTPVPALGCSTASSCARSWSSSSCSSARSAAYAFSRFRFKGRRGGLLALLLIQMFPQFLAAVALFTLFTDIGEVIPQVGLNTLLGYILVHAAAAPSARSG